MARAWSSSVSPPPSNRAFVESLGCYDRVVTYDELSSLDASTPDHVRRLLGRHALRAKIHHYFGDALATTASPARRRTRDPHHLKTEMPGPKPELYFAPVQIDKRNKDWGYREVNRRFGEAQKALHRARVGSRAGRG